MLAISRLLFAPARALVVLAVLIGFTLVAAGPAQAAPAADDTSTESATTPTVTKAGSAGGVKPGKLGIKKKAKKAKKAALAKRALGVARKQVGDPYRYGAAGPQSFDCSGLILFSYRAAGFKKLPRTSGAQASFARRIPRAALKPGDLMFFTGSGGVYHAGIFAGRKKGRIVMLHAPSTGKRVSYTSPWTNAWFAATVRR